MVPAHNRGSATAQLLADELIRTSSTICAIESLTGGLVAAEISAIPGASHFFTGGVVAYQVGAKASVLGIPQQDLSEQGTVSEACVSAMVRSGLKLFGTDVCIATSGVAGPETLEGMPAGSVWIAVGSLDRIVTRFEVFRGSTRDQVRARTVDAALHLAYGFLKNGDTPAR